MPDRSGVRLASLMASLSLATDLGLGQPMEHAVRSCVVAVRLGEAAGLSDKDLKDAYYLALLRFIGCSSAAGPVQAVFGDEIAARSWMTAAFTGPPEEMMNAIVEHVGAGEPPEARQARIASVFQAMPSLYYTGAEQCEVAQLLATRMGFGEDIRDALGKVFEHWDGSGVPNRIRGDDIPLPVQVVQLAQNAAIFSRLGGLEAASQMARRRSGSAHDPALVEKFLTVAPDVLAGIESSSIWEEALDSEPGEKLIASEEELDRALEAMADFTDLKSSHMLGHSREVAGLAGLAAGHMRLSGDDATMVRRAGLVHDVGRSAVSVAIWDKPARLTEGEWERARLHPYYTERIFSRSLPALGRLAAHHHERLDGGGYHRGLEGAHLTPSDRLLAAADFYQALGQGRPYRPAKSADEAATMLRGEADSGRLDADAVDALLAVSGIESVRRRRALPAGLTNRELEVLQLLVQGHSNRVLADRLSISMATVDHHLRHIYNKIGVSTRAAAAVFALQNDLLGSGPAAK